MDGRIQVSSAKKTVFSESGPFLLSILKMSLGTLSLGDCSDISDHYILGIFSTGTNAFSHSSNNDVHFHFFYVHFHFYLGSVTCPAKSNAAFKPGEKYPLLVFSHGLGAFR